ncbi:hypothetical protein AGMMS49928_19550 [Spirochaetia bacterium]|nr:hypothetical protein AGMMS49928_19550 [Spirochaetia bacterium]
MKKTSKKISVDKILLGIVIFLALVILAGTIYAKNKRPEKTGLPPLLTPLPTITGDQNFTGIGRIRALTRPPNPATVIFSITFPYNQKDKASSEELALKIKDFRQTASDYLGSLTAEELRSLSEDEIKKEMLRRYNSLLLLSQIEVLYINDFMIIE